MAQEEPVVYVKLSGKPADTPPPKKPWGILSILGAIVAVTVNILGILFGTCVIPTSSATTPEFLVARNDIPLDLSKSLNGFSMDLYKKLVAKSPTENVFFSPMSVMTAMSMTLLGCKQNTFYQLADVLKFKLNQDQVKEAFEELIKKYKKESPDYDLRTANMMYVSDQLELKKGYSESLKDNFDAKFEKVDFSNAAAEVTKKINSAVEEKTNNKIKDLIPEGALDSLTRLVLVNAVYFKGLWAIQFEKNRSSDEDFFTSETATPLTVPRMTIKDKFQFSENNELDASLIALDYKNSNLSMVIVLPKQKEGLDVVEDKLNQDHIGNFIKSASKVEVRVGLPKFKLEYESELSDTLSELGAKDLFKPGESDLSGIGSTPGDLYVSNVFHKAFVEVNEEGTEAAAATGAVGTPLNLPPRPKQFIVDRPFSFFIYDRDLEMPLFAGRVKQPTVSEQ